MARLKFDSKNIDNVIIPSIKDSIVHLNSALDNINNVSIPNECDINLVNSKNDIESVKSNLNSLNDWCNRSISLFKNVEDKYIGEAMLLPNDIMPLRKNKIKG